MDPRQVLERLRVPNDAVPGRSVARKFGLLPVKPFRPLGAFSDFVCEELGSHNQLVYEKSLSGGELFALAERKFGTVPGEVIDGLLASGWRAERRVGLLDLLWVLRSLDIACADDPTYRRRKRESPLFAVARRLAHVERRHPALSWSDIAIYHPVQDPRTFLAPGLARDEEILMYTTQNALERIYKRILGQDWLNLSIPMLSDLVCDLDYAPKGLIHYSMVRTIGQFYQLDPYLGPNNEYRGHATGAFSAWTFLIGIFLSGNDSFARRLCDETNWKGFDRDADPYIEQVVAGTFKSLGKYMVTAPLACEERAQADALYREARRLFTLFLRSHKGAITRHAKASFADPSPTEPVNTNAYTIREAIDDMAIDRASISAPRPALDDSAAAQPISPGVTSR